MGVHDEVQIGSLPTTITQNREPRKERCHKNEEESRSAPGSPKIENRRVNNQRRQYYSHHSGSSSECPTKKSSENLNKDGIEEDHERLARSGSMALGGGTVHSGSHGRRSSSFQSGSNNNNSQSQDGSSGNTTSPSGNIASSTMTVYPANASNLVAEESDSDLGPNQPSTSNSRSRQKKFLKTFKHLPPEELVLQRYSCALVSDILLQGHLYITQNYFAFYSNVFGYVTKLEIQISKVTKISKEKTAKIIPNAIGLCTRDEKHIFASLLSRDATFKLMTRLWTRATRDLPAELILGAAVLPENPLETELDDEEEFIPDDDDLSTDSEGGIVTLEATGVTQISPDAIDSSYLVKRLSQTSGTLFYHQSSLGANKSKSSQTRKNNNTTLYTGKYLTPNDMVDSVRRRSSSVMSPASSGVGILAYLTRSTILSVFVIILLIFLLCSSVYLVFRVDALQKQVESRYGSKRSMDLDHILAEASSQKVQEAIDANVDHITTVRKSLEKLTDILSSNKKEET